MVDSDSSCSFLLVLFKGFELQSSHAILGKLMLIIFYFSSKIATIITNGDIFDIEKSFPLLNTTLLLAQFWKLDNDTKRN